MADTREGQVCVGAVVQSVRGETGYSFWVVQQTKIVGCFPGVQALTVRCCPVSPVNMLAVEVANIGYRLGCGNVGMACGVSGEHAVCDVNDLTFCDIYAHHSVSDCSGDWSTSSHSNRLWTNVARACFLLRTDPASEKLGITNLSSVA